MEYHKMKLENGSHFCLLLAFVLIICLSVISRKIKIMYEEEHLGETVNSHHISTKLIVLKFNYILSTRVRCTTYERFKQIST